jgi:5-methylcytosine-specific restriction endonuclease McrA
VLPVSRCGPSEIWNLTTACKPCNRSKRDKTPEEWHGGPA